MRYVTLVLVLLPLLAFAQELPPPRRDHLPENCPNLKRMPADSEGLNDLAGRLLPSINRYVGREALRSISSTSQLYERRQDRLALT